MMETVHASETSVFFKETTQRYIPEGCQVTVNTLILFLKIYFNIILSRMLTYPSRGKGFSSSLCVQTSFVAHPVSCPMGTGEGPSPKVKRGLRVMLTTHPPI
jgi:hypothetical protein